MDSILVRGGQPLNGEIPIAGAKNACLTLMPATLGRPKSRCPAAAPLARAPLTCT